MTISTLLAAAAMLQAESLDPYFKFKPDTVWIYERSDTSAKGVRKISITMKVLKEVEGKVSVECKEPLENGQIDTMIYRWYAKDGFLVWAALTPTGEQLLYQFYKAGSKKGDTWEAKTAPGVKLTATHRGTSDVTVPAGTYKGAVCIRLEGEARGQKILQDWYFVPNVGVVKFDDIAEKSSGELKEFQVKK